MVSVRPVTADAVDSYKHVRLRALRDAPLAFGSTYASESQLPDEEWERRVVRWNRDGAICYLAWDSNETCGLAAGFLDPENPTTTHLVSMWVAPSHRRRGVGRLLVNSIVEWALSQHAETMRLTVTSANDVAIRFYQRLGFTTTGNTEPYPNDPSLWEFEMIKTIHLDGGAG